LTNYYAAALKDNAPDTVAMKKVVYASIFHMMSTDEDPDHSFCATGWKSLCHYQRETALGLPRTHHTNELKQEHGLKLMDLYKRLTDPDLLERCNRMKTQNANECFNAQYLRRCPKTEPTSRKTIEMAVSMAIPDFNQGLHGFRELLKLVRVKNIGKNLQHSLSVLKGKDVPGRRGMSLRNVPAKAGNW